MKLRLLAVLPAVALGAAGCGGTSPAPTSHAVSAPSAKERAVHKAGEAKAAQARREHDAQRKARAHRAAAEDAQRKAEEVRRAQVTRGQELKTALEAERKTEVRRQRKRLEAELAAWRANVATTKAETHSGSPSSAEESPRTDVQIEDEERPGAEVRRLERELAELNAEESG